MALLASKSKKIALIKQKECVGCGTCIKVCPKKAIDVPKGIYAVVERDLCVGCGLCKKACPASVIQIIAREYYKDEEGVA